MQRLTKIDGTNAFDLIACFECGAGAGVDNENCGMCDKFPEAVQRLGAYEDAGRLPGTQVFVLYEDCDSSQWEIGKAEYIGLNRKRGGTLVDCGEGDSFELVEEDSCDVFEDYVVAEAERIRRNEAAAGTMKGWVETVRISPCNVSREFVEKALKGGENGGS